MLRVDHQVLSFEMLSGFYGSCAAAAQSWPRVGEGQETVGALACLVG